MVMLLQKYPNKGYVVQNLGSVTLLNTDYKTLANVLAKYLALVVNRLVCDAQACSTPAELYTTTSTSRYTNSISRDIGRVGTEPDMGSVLVPLDQSKAFDRVNDLHLKTIFKVTGFQRLHCFNAQRPSSG